MEYNLRLSLAWVGALLLLAVVAGSGCAQRWQMRGESFEDELANWGEQNRPVDHHGVYGFSTKAQQIERNLGVR